MHRLIPIALVLLAGMCLLPGDTALAASRELHAPFVTVEENQPISLVLDDSSGRGALIRVYLHESDGSIAVRDGDPVVITRAIPPSERVRVDLSERLGRSFEGSIRVSSSQPVTARLHTSDARYALWEGPGQSRLLFLPPPGAAEPRLAVLNPGAAEVEFTISGRGSSERGKRRFLAAGACGLFRFGRFPNPSEGVIVVASGPVVGLMFQPLEGALHIVAPENGF